MAETAVIAGVGTGNTGETSQSVLALSGASTQFEHAAWMHVAANPNTAMWALGADLRVSFCSQKAVDLFVGATKGTVGSISCENVLGKPLQDLVPRDVVVRMQRFMRMLAENGGSITGSSVWGGRRVRSTFHAIREESGRLAHMLVFTMPAPLSLAAPTGVDEADYVQLGDFDVLTRRELEVLAHIGMGLTLTEIAQRLGVSIKTVKRFRDGIAGKLGVGDRTTLALRARDAGLTPSHARLRRL